MLQDFRDFALRGSLLDVAIAFVLGVAFAAVVTSAIDDIVMQLIGAIFGEPDFGDLSFAVADAEIRYGAFINEVIVFVLIALAAFLVVKALTRAFPAQFATKSCPHCTSAIPAGASACKFCTRDVGGGMATGA